MAHDLKNIFNSLGLYLELVQRSAERGDVEAVRAQVQVMRQSIRRGVEAVGQARGADERDAAREGEELDLNDLVREACAIAQPIAQGTHQVREELAPSVRLCGSSTEIVSALVNLAVNAFEALPRSGGTVTFQTGCSARSVWVLVADDGPGMSADIERRAFEPFFTTKGARGTGLGLALVKGCMQHHGGRVTLETAPGRGARFTLVFPSP